LLQNSAILRHALQTPFVRLTYDPQYCATQRKPAKKLSLELQISDSTHPAVYYNKFTAVSQFTYGVGAKALLCHGSALPLS